MLGSGNRLKKIWNKIENKVENKILKKIEKKIEMRFRNFQNQVRIVINLIIVNHRNDQNHIKIVNLLNKLNIENFRKLWLARDQNLWKTMTILSRIKHMFI